VKWLRYYDPKGKPPQIVTWSGIVALLIGFLILFLCYEPLLNIDW
jgi:hypothetical protein